MDKCVNHDCYCNFYQYHSITSYKTNRKCKGVIIMVGIYVIDEFAFLLGYFERDWNVRKTRCG